MTDTTSFTSAPLVWVQDDILVKGKKGVRMICVMESSLPPDDLKETIESLIEIGLSQVEKMREVLQIAGEILRRDGRFQDISEEMRRYGEIVFREDRCIPFTMIEARAILSKMQKWLNAIERRLETEQGR
jgi:hypothetical protein